MAPTWHVVSIFRHRFRRMEGTLEGLRALGVTAPAFPVGRHSRPAATLTLDVAEPHGGCRLARRALAEPSRGRPPAGEIGRCRGAAGGCVATSTNSTNASTLAAAHYWLAGEVVFDLESGHSWPG